MEFQSTVLKRRMIRNFQKDPVPDPDIRRILELGIHGPSAGFSQGMSYIVIKDERTKIAIGGKEEIFPNGMHNYVSYAPVLIVVCVSAEAYHRRYREPDKLQEDGTEIEWPTPYWFFDAGAASMIMLLAAVDLGFAAVFSGIPSEEMARFKKLLNIPEEFHPTGIISLGKPAPDVKSPSLKRGRKPLESIVHFERW